VYEVLDGEEFERRFNDLRKVRSKVKASGTERPFSRMYNFYILEHGDKWARTGTKFRPRCEAGQPTPEILAAVRAFSSTASTPSTPRTPSSVASSSSSRVLSVASAGQAVYPASPKRDGPLASPRTSARPHAAPRAVYEAETSRSRPRDATSVQRATSAPVTASHVRAPPASPRHQPRMPPSAAAVAAPPPTSSRVLGKRPAANYQDDRDNMPAEQRARLSEHIYRSFRHNGVPVDAHPRPVAPGPGPNAHHAHHHNHAAGKVERFPFGTPSYQHNHREEAAYAKVHHAAVPFTTHAHSDFTTHDMERAQEQQQVQAMDHFVPSDMYRAPSPIEIDDASSGFPSPECLLAIAGDFVGSPLDLGDPELPLFGMDEDALGTSGRDHTLLKQPYENENEEAWAALREVMW